MKPGHFLVRSLSNILLMKAVFCNVLSTQNIAGFVRAEDASFLLG